MEAPTIKIINSCNFSCRHCLTAKPDKPVYLDKVLFEHIVSEMRKMGFKYVAVTGGGEMTLHPQLEDLFYVLVKYNMDFEILTNGYLFKERLLPLLKTPVVRKSIKAVGFSLDGAKQETHDYIREKGSFIKIVEAMGFCKLFEIPFYVKTVVTNVNKNELKELLLFTSGLRAFAHLVISPMPTRRMIEEGDIPDPVELRKIASRLLCWKRKGIFPILEIEAFDNNLFACNGFRKFSVDEEGNYIFCGNLSNVETYESPAVTKERLGNLKDMKLKELVIKHFKFLPEVLKWRLERKEAIRNSSFSLCYWCFHQFEKLNWMEKCPDSPWSIDALLKSMD